MKVWDVTLTCDHKLLVKAPSLGWAVTHALIEAEPHGSRIVGEPVEVDLSTPGLLAWYPGPWGEGAIIDYPSPDEALEVHDAAWGF